MTENNENSMYFLFENPAIIDERIYGVVIVNKDGEHGKIHHGDDDGDDVQMHNFMITGNSLEPDVSRTPIKNREPLTGKTLINTFDIIHNTYV